MPVMFADKLVAYIKKGKRGLNIEICLLSETFR